MALRNLGIDHEVVAISDVDEFTVKSYTAIHDNDKTVSEVTEEEMHDYLEKRNIPLNDKGVRKVLKGKKLKEFYEACIKSNNLGDISKVETHDIPDHDLFTYSFPCQDISVAGKGSGLDEGSDTRSGLLWECQKVIYGKRPKYLLLENVKNLVGKKHKHNFDKWLEWLEKQGYRNYWQVLNAKDYGVPQNRERVFVVSILGHHEPYEFPEPIELELRLKDVLEDAVDEKFYLDDEQTKRLTGNTFNQANLRVQEKDYSDTLLARDYKDPKCVRVGGIFDKDGTKHQAGAVWDKNQISPTLDTMQGGWRQPSVVVDNPEGIPIKNATKKGYINAYDGDGVDLAYPDSKTRRGRVQKGLSQTLDTSDSKGVVIGASRGRNPENPSDRTVGSPTEQRLEINKQGTSNTITTVQKDNYVIEPSNLKHTELPCIYDDRDKGFGIKTSDVCPTQRANRYGIKCIETDYRIRKLTPKECWRLMGFSDDDFHKAEKVNSNSQLYKQAGNSIVVDVLEGIFNQLLEEK